MTTPPPQSADAPRRKPSCLARTIGSALDGGIFGAAIGSLMATGPAFSHGLLQGGLAHILRSGVRSALSVGGFMATYNGGLCTLEKTRQKRDVFNPFFLGGFIGVAGAIPGYVQPLASAPWAYRNPRALIGSGLGSAALCSFFWMISSGGAVERTEQPAAPPTAPVMPTAAPAVPAPLPGLQAEGAFAQLAPAQVAVETPGFAQPAAAEVGGETPSFAPSFTPAAVEVDTPGFAERLPPPPPTSDRPAQAGGEQMHDPWASSK